MVLTFWFLIFFYSFLLLVGMLVWSLKDRHRSSPKTDCLVSVIVPFRNEQEDLPALVKALNAQNYPEYEVIFIDDHSTDNSSSVLEQALQQASFRHLICRLISAEGKKSAIELGISRASGEIILTTDADCVFGESWILEMTKPFIAPHIQMVAGPVQLLGTSLFQRWQRMEFATLIASGGIMIRAGGPTMANGANLAYRKSVFEAVKGFENIRQSPSGDDELLMMKVREQYPKGITFRKQRGAMVFTQALSSWSDFEQQRLRWASKWRIGKRRSSIILAMLIFLVNLSWVLLPFAYWLGMISPDSLITIFRIRLVTEAIWLMCLSRFFSGVISIRAFLLHQVLYPFYVIYFGVKANFGNYRWKGRSYKV